MAAPAASPRPFLEGVPLRPVRLPPNWPFEAVGLALGSGDAALEVLVSRATQAPALTTVRSAWRARHGNRPAPLMLVVLYDGQAALCGPSGDDPPAHAGVDVGH